MTPAYLAALGWLPLSEFARVALGCHPARIRPFVYHPRKRPYRAGSMPFAVAAAAHKADGRWYVDLAAYRAARTSTSRIANREVQPPHR